MRMEQDVGILDQQVRQEEVGRCPCELPGCGGPARPQDPPTQRGPDHPVELAC